MKFILGLFITLLCVSQTIAQPFGHWRTGGNPGGGLDGVNATNNILGTNAGVNFPLRIHTNGIQRMFLNSGNGFIGLGNSFSNPLSLLHVNGFGNNTGQLFRTDGSALNVNVWSMRTGIGNLFLTEKFRAYTGTGLVNGNHSLDITLQAHSEIWCLMQEVQWRG